MTRPGPNFWGLFPVHLFMAVTLVVPIGIVLLVSFATKGPYGGFEFEFTAAPYRQLLFNEGWSGEPEFNPQYLVIVGRTAVLAGLTTAICLLAGFPIAYFIARQRPGLRGVLVFLVTLPFWVSMIVRVYAWLIILGNEGVVEKLARLLGLADDLGTLLFTNGAMLTGMVYSYIPLMVLPIYASVEKLDRSLVEASHDLYGSRLVTLRRVILPLAKPGMVAGSILVFIPCMGAVLEPILLGGGKHLMMGNLIAMQFGGARNWPLGSALAVVLMSLVLVALAVRARRAAANPAGAA